MEARTDLRAEAEALRDALACLLRFDDGYMPYIEPQESADLILAALLRARRSGMEKARDIAREYAAEERAEAVQYDRESEMVFAANCGFRANGAESVAEAIEAAMTQGED